MVCWKEMYFYCAKDDALHNDQVADKKPSFTLCYSGYGMTDYVMDKVYPVLLPVLTELMTVYREQMFEFTKKPDNERILAHPIEFIAQKLKDC